MLRKLVPPLAYAYLTFVGATTRLVVRGEEARGRLRAAGRRFIYACWHEQQAFITWTHRGAGATVLVSRSRDGELIAGVLALSRIGSVRGSSSRGGAAALRELAQALREGLDVGITPDGPRGPAREAKSGVVFLARQTGAPILPIACALSRKAVLSRSWDRFQVPLPFGRAAVVYGEPIEVAAGDDPAAKAAELKASLDRISEEARRLAGA